MGEEEVSEIWGVKVLERRGRKVAEVSLDAGYAERGAVRTRGRDAAVARGLGRGSVSDGTGRGRRNRSGGSRS